MLYIKGKVKVLTLGYVLFSFLLNLMHVFNSV